MTVARDGMKVRPVNGLAALVDDDRPTGPVEVPEVSVDMLIA